MRKILMMVAAAIMAATTLTSCDTEFSSGDDANPEEYHAQIANTRWQLAEVMNQNNEWVQSEFYSGFDIPELSFGYSNSYFMKIATTANRSDVSYINGTYSIDNYFAITMTIDNYQGIAYILKVASLNGNTLEGEFLDWKHEQRRHTIRMKRTDK